MKKLILLTIILLPIIQCASCPWDIESAISWTESRNGWTMPTNGATVVIDNQIIIINDENLNITVNSIHVTNGGQLIWGNVDNVVLEARHVLVDENGEFIIGSKECPFVKTAKIVLVGLHGNTEIIDGFGSKFLGIGNLGTLEMHGDPSIGPSWTKLAKTANSDKFIIRKQTGRGIQINTFTLEGSFIKSQNFDTHGDVNSTRDAINFINNTMDNIIITMHCRDECSNRLDENFYNVMENLGSNLVRNISSRDGFTFFAIKGNSESAVEGLETRASGLVSIIKPFYYNSNLDFNLTFTVKSSGYESGNIGVTELKVVRLEDSILTFTTPVNWPVGSKIALTSTDFSQYQAEERIVVDCPECNAYQVKYDVALDYTHFGEIQHGVDLRGEVALLSRNIIIEGAMEQDCYSFCEYFDYDTFGGHFKVIAGFTNVHVRNVEFYHLGQQILGSYPVHFHLAGHVGLDGGYTNPTSVVDCSIHHSFSRFVTIHGTHGLLVKNTVGYDALGHGFFFEDGIETKNIIDGCLGFVNRPGILLPTDRNSKLCLQITPTDFNGNPTSTGECNAISTYWMTNADNILINNVAAGSLHTGFWYIFPRHPTGPSWNTSINLWNVPLQKFDNNTAHSNGINGIFFDSGINVGQPSAGNPLQHLAKSSMRYKPREDPFDYSSPRAPALLSNMVLYKNRQRGIWVRGGEFRLKNLHSADNFIGATLASEGTLPNDPGSKQTLDGCIFIGESTNVGSYSTHPDMSVVYSDGRTHASNRNSPIRGFEMYDGPISVNNCQFYNFNKSDTKRNASALGMLLNNNWQNSPYNNISRAFFDEGSRIFWALGSTNNYKRANDGLKNTIWRDLDGTTTGMIGGSVVNLKPYHTTHRCVEKPEWQAAVCDETYAYIYIQNLRKDLTNWTNTIDGLGTVTIEGEPTSIILIRDEKPDYQHRMKGLRAGPVRYQPYFISGKSYTIHFPYPTPPQLRFTKVNFNPSGNVRLGICYPTGDTTFVVTQYDGKSTVSLEQVFTLDEVDSTVNGSVYYWDNVVGLLFVKVTTFTPRIGDHYCGMNGCEYIQVVASGTNVGKVNGDCIASAYPKYQIEEYIPDDVGCVGGLDKCGECNGDGRTCGFGICRDNCTLLDINSKCLGDSCVCLEGYTLQDDLCKLPVKPSDSSTGLDITTSLGSKNGMLLAICIAFLYVIMQ